MEAENEHKKILRQRAELLARPVQRAEDIGRLETIEFLLAHERYAFESKYILEVYPLAELTPVPCTPDFVFGVVNWRGLIVTVIDLKQFFALPDKGLTDLNKIIIIQNADLTLGILADQILGIGFAREQQIKESLPTLAGIHADFIKGITEDRVVVLDAAGILSDQQLLVDEEH